MDERYEPPRIVDRAPISDPLIGARSLISEGQGS
jgi:hypothetical protein